jgi:SSS family solute:Na+ symporter
LSQVISFHVSPRLWQLGREHGLQTQADFFAQRYGEGFLPVLVAVIGIAAIIPYLQLQLTGLGIIVEIASFDRIGRGTATVIAGVLIGAFVLISGIRAVAAVSVLKDFLMAAVVVAIGVAVPYIHFGGVGAMFARLAQEQPAHLVMPGGTVNLGHTWYVSTVLICALGLMWPHSFAAVFTARSGETLRRNAVVLPLYNLSLAFVFIVGFAAILLFPKLTNGDLSLLTVVRATFPPWFLGIVGGAGALTAMVPAAVMVLTASTLFAKNVFRPVCARGLTDAQVARLARLLVVALTATSLGLALSSSTSLVSLLLLGYDGVSQFLPGVILGLFWRRVTRGGVLAGIIGGVLVTTFLVLTHRDPFFGWNAGFIGLGANLATTGLFAWRSGSRAPARVALRATGEALGSGL